MPPSESGHRPPAATRPRSRTKARTRVLRALAVTALCVAVVACGVTRLAPFGAAPEGARLQAVQASPQWRDGSFHNPQPQWVDVSGGLWDAVFMPANPNAVPQAPLAVPATPVAALAQPPESGLRITWFGHSSTLVEVDGVRVLADPFWGERASPVNWIGPRRWYAPPLALQGLPAIDAVVISHDHYDHLDMGTIQRLGDKVARYIVPLGLGAHLQRWGVAPERITELDWWQSAQVGALQITATPARHSSGRLSNASNHTLWAGYALVGPRHRVWFSGDTSVHDDLTRIGEKLGPFDATLIDAGQYDGNWPDAHLGPELAVEAHRLVRGKLMVPVHWGLMQLAPHTWTEPVERVLRQARCQGVTVQVLRPGQPQQPLVDAPPAPWWPQLPVRTAQEAPVPSTMAGDPAQRVVVPACAVDATQPAGT